jgi:hypothetical protein
MLPCSSTTVGYQLRRSKVLDDIVGHWSLTATGQLEHSRSTPVYPGFYLSPKYYFVNESRESGIYFFLSIYTKKEPVV